MRISREGFPTIAITNLALIGTLIAYFLTSDFVVAFLFITLVLIDLLVLYFFRDPDRNIPTDPDVIVSPADGKVILVRDVHEELFIKGKAQQVSIFLSVFNVHVNRIPVTGTVGYCQYVPGRFLAAFKEAASVQNEQTVIGIENQRCRLLFKQIAGLLARRIVYNLRTGANVQAGERFGIIKFGSRVDMFFPENIKLTVRVGDRVFGGSSVVGRIKST